MNNQLALTNEQLFSQAPSVFADQPYMGMSGRYKFIPTIEIVEQLRSNGFFPVAAMESKTSVAAKQGMTKHMVKFRQEQFIGEAAVVGNEVPEIKLVNSHDGSSLYEMLMGIYRFVCGNGMTVQAHDFGSYQVKHTGLIEDLIETTYKIVADFPKALEQIDNMKAVVLPPVKQSLLAEKALLIKDPEKTSNVDYSLLLKAKREDDETTNGDRSLWNTFNVIQENMMKGGLEGKSVRTVDNQVIERKTKTRAIKSIQEDLRLNKALWSLATDQLLIAA